MVRSTQQATETRRTKGNHKAREAEGVIHPGEIFTIDAFADRIGTTRTGLNEMRRRGMKARQDGPNRVRILASDYEEYLKNQPVAELE